VDLRHFIFYAKHIFMNTSQIHLAFTHLPVVLSLVGLVILVISLVKKNPLLTKVSFYILLFAGLTSLPVFFTGEGAEETVEHLPGVSGSLIEAHEDFAKIALFAVLGTALVALAGLLSSFFVKLTKTITMLALLLALSSSVLLAQTAHLGGQIRHTEIRSGSNGAVNNSNQTNAVHDNDD
jgi:uncharacterized membrane protein